MSLRQKIIGFYLNSSIHVAIAICALAAVTCLNFNLELKISFFSFLFTASIVGYNFAKYASHFQKSVDKHRPDLLLIIIFSLCCVPVLLYTLTLQNFRFIEIVGLLGLLTFFYSLPFLPHKKNLRRLKGLKIYIIAVVWTGATLWLPLSGKHPLFTKEIFLESSAYFMLVLALLIPFEIRDLSSDEPLLGTLPQQWGIPKTKRYGYALLMGFTALLWLNTPNTIEFNSSGTFIALLTAIFIHRSQRNQSAYYASFWVESIPIFWLCMLIVFRH